MHKKHIGHPLRSSGGGFLLVEFIIAFAILSIAVLVCAHSFLTTVHEYGRAKQRLRILTALQNSLESSWIGGASSTATASDRMVKRTVSIKHGIVLPNMPVLTQEKIESDATDNKNFGGVQLRGVIKEK